MKRKPSVKSFVLPVLTIAAFGVFLFFFYRFFVAAPKERAGEIRQMIAEGKTDEAVAVLSDYSYGEFSDRKTYDRLIGASPRYQLYTLGIGDVIRLGRYEQDGNASEAEEIEWRVIDKDGNRLYLETVMVIEALPLYEVPAGVRAPNASEWDREWETSTLYKWLNGAFYETAFTDEERKLISGEDGKKISILEYDSGYTMLLDGETVDASAGPATQYVLNKGVELNREGHARVWTCSQYKLLFLFYNGYRYSGGKAENTGKAYGVRPVMWIETVPLNVDSEEETV